MALAALAAAQVAVSAVQAPSTTEPLRIIAINVAITDAKLILDQRTVALLNVGQFRVRNRTAVARTFAIGGQKVRVAPKGNKVMLVYFDTRGKYAYASTAARQPTLRGVFIVY